MKQILLARDAKYMNDDISSFEGIRSDIRGLEMAITELTKVVRSQEERLSVLEKSGASGVARKLSGEHTPIVPGEGRTLESSVPIPPPYVSPSVSVPPSSPGVSLGEWFGVDWPMKVGALLILLGFGWFVSYAFANNWIGPVGRITLGTILGAAILAFGHIRMRHSVNQGSVLLGLGTATILLTVFAARELYDFFTPLLALVFISMVVIFTAYSSVVFRSRALAFMSLVSGGIAPLLTAGESNFLGLFSYLFCLSAGMLWVVRLTAWRSLVLVALGIVTVYSIPFIISSNGVERGEAMLVAFFFATLFFLTGLFGMLKDRLVDRYDLFVVALNGFLLLGWIQSFVPSYLQSVVTAGAVIAFSVAAFLVYRATGISAPVYLYAGNAALFLTVATAYELSGASFVIALAFEAGLIVSGSVVFLRNMPLSKKLGLFMVLPIVFSFDALSKYASLYSGRFDSAGTLVFTEDFFAIFSISFVAGLLALLYWTAEEKISENQSVTVSQLFFLLSTLYAVFLVWFGLKRAIDDVDMAVLCALVLFTLFGIGFYLKGRLSESRDLRVFGSVFLIGVAVRLLLVEVWQMDIFGRIITFFVIGALFMSTAFLGKKKSFISGTSSFLLFLFLTILSSFFGRNAIAVGNDSTLPDISPYEYVKSVSLPSLSVPAVVEVPLSDPRFQKSGFVVYEETSHSFQPTELFIANETHSAKFSVSALVDEGIAPALVDGDILTEVEFSIRDDDMERRADIRLSSSERVSLSGITLDLAPYASLPRTVEIRTIQGGVEKVILARSSVSSRTIRFPEETATEWILSFSYAQPLRIREISFFEERARFIQARSLRFLARPRESYKIFFGADRDVPFSLGESSDFSDDRDVLRLIEPETLPNTLYIPADTDRDGVRDLLDNCVDMSNADQSDQNENGRGDVCDDYDKDGIVNGVDNCPDNPNRTQTDTDGDRKGDVCDMEENRITEKYAWLPWIAIMAVGVLVGILFVATVRRERNI